MENFAIVAALLQKAAAKKTKKFEMTDECMNSYRILREELKSKFLMCPDFDKDFILDTDACLDGISGVLSQPIDEASYAQILSNTVTAENASEQIELPIAT